MDVEIETEGEKHGIETLSAGLILLSGIFFLLLLLCLQKKGNLDGFFALPFLVDEVRGRWEREWSPRSICCPSKDASDRTDPRGKGPVYLIAWTVIIGWLFTTSIWFFVLFANQDLVAYHVDRSVRASVLVTSALCLHGVSYIPLRVGTPCYLWVSFFLLLSAHLCVLIAETTLNPWGYPGVGIWLTAGVGFSLYSGWSLYLSSLSYGMAISASYPIDQTRRPNSDDTFYPFVPLFFSLYASIAACILPSPGLPFWFFFVLVFFGIRLPLLTASCVIALLGVMGSVIRIVVLRGLI